MNILFLSCHSVLEYDEVRLFVEMGHKVFSHGAYIDPAGNPLLPRPGIPDLEYMPEFAQMARENPQTKLPREMVEWADVVIAMHKPSYISGNWKLFRELNKPVVWRSIGQSNKQAEKTIAFYRSEGLKIVRYSPKERNLPSYAGEDVLIRFYKNPAEFELWTGGSGQVVNFTQALKGRRQFCHYDEIMPVISHFNGTVYGPGNADLGERNGGQIPWEKMLQTLREAEVFVYGGSWPASYTLSFMEAMMVGTPTVAISRRLAQEIPGIEYLDFYEVDEIIENGISGFICDSVPEMIDRTRELLDNKTLASSISQAARSRAIEYFGKEKIKNQWENFLRTL